MWMVINEEFSKLLFFIGKLIDILIMVDYILQMMYFSM